jgi:hypothetical protein
VVCSNYEGTLRLHPARTEPVEQLGTVVHPCRAGESDGETHIHVRQAFEPRFRRCQANTPLIALSSALLVPWPVHRRLPVFPLAWKPAQRPRERTRWP